jgi:hypothetical protein
MFFAKSQSGAPHGLVDLVDCLAVKSAEAKAQRKNAFEIILRDETFLMSSQTDQEKDTWIGQIGKAIVKNSGMFMQEYEGSGNPADEDDNEDDQE